MEVVHLLDSQVDGCISLVRRWQTQRGPEFGEDLLKIIAVDVQRAPSGDRLEEAATGASAEIPQHREGERRFGIARSASGGSPRRKVELNLPERELSAHIFPCQL